MDPIAPLDAVAATGTVDAGIRMPAGTMGGGAQIMGWVVIIVT